MSCTSHSPERDIASYASFESEAYPGVEFRVRKMTLRQRIALLSELRELYQEAEFGKAGSSGSDQIRAQVSGLRIEERFLKWGVVQVQGLVVDGREVAVDELAEWAPEPLASEMLRRIAQCIGLTPGEEKN